MQQILWRDCGLTSVGLQYLPVCTRAEGGNKLSQAGPSNSSYQNSSDTQRSWGSENARLGQAVALVGTCNIWDWEQSMPSRAAAPASMCEIWAGSKPGRGT